jgi:FkbM family methyltransferase
MVKRRIVTPETAFDLCVPDGKALKLGIYHAGRLPHEVSALLSVLTRTTVPGSKVLDLGGYIGGFGLGAAALGYDVTIVEANPQNAALIQQSVDANRLQVQLVHAAIGATPGEVRFVADGPWGHVATAADFNTVPVPQHTLPQLLTAVGWTAPAFIKMDVEGSEANMLIGAREWFAQGHRPVILYEANAVTLQWFQATPKHLNTLIDSLGYHRYEMADDGGLRIPNLFEPRALVDYLASPVPLAEVAPALSKWRIFKRTLRALRHPAPVARRYTASHVVSTLIRGT